MSTFLRHAITCLMALAIVGCRQQPAEPAATTPTPTVAAPAAVTGNDAEARALHVLQAQLQRDRAYPDNCISILTEAGETPAADAFEFAVHERHGNGCPGDPQTSPVRDRFRVQADGTVLWYDVVNADFVDYAERARSLQ